MCFYQTSFKGNHNNRIETLDVNQLTDPGEEIKQYPSMPCLTINEKKEELKSTCISFKMNLYLCCLIYCITEYWCCSQILVEINFWSFRRSSSSRTSSDQHFAFWRTSCNYEIVYFPNPQYFTPTVLVLLFMARRQSGSFWVNFWPRRQSGPFWVNLWPRRQSGSSWVNFWVF